jgi:hypothetical protein
MTMGLHHALVIDTQKMPWESGLDYLRTLTPAFRDNLGPADQVEANFAKYRQKNLYLDRDSTRRLDLVQLEPGYSDLTHCCHDSVEEGFLLGGEVVLDGEGTLHEGDYFWRPPGWIHHARTQPGVELLLGFEGRSNESGPVSRHVCAAQLAGSNHLIPSMNEASLGTRGRVCKVSSPGLVWQPGAAYARSEGPLMGFDLEHLSVRVLSRNPLTGQQTVLFRLAPGYQQSSSGSHAVWWQMFVLSGGVQWGDEAMGPGVFVHQPAGTVEAAMTSPHGALIYAKVNGWLDFTPSCA